MRSGWKGFLKLVHGAEDEKQLNELFDLLLTLEERAMLEKRMHIIHDLLQGDFSQREIAEKHHLSIAAITRGSNALKLIHQRLKEYVQQCLID